MPKTVSHVVGSTSFAPERWLPWRDYPRPVTPKK
ncbi:hypothetical protein QF048_007488 [Streptomyces sp. W4I9-2]|nr:hypothetical protein [Streptomyces sp. W4I9-2]